MSAYLRRALLVAFAIGAAAVLVRTQLSSALVSRGDALAFWGAADRAQTMYARALWFDRDNAAAADRLTFAAMMTHDRRALGEGVSVAARFLARHPEDTNLRMDRALCYQRLGMLAEASRDFERVGRERRDARAFLFAALDDLRLARGGRAHVLLREAVADDPSFLPARVALAR